MFLDQTTISVDGGKGGDGAVSFLRQKFRPLGGPSGGDGGDGGNLIITADNDLSSLTNLDRVGYFKAEDGQNGMKDRKKGKDGDDLILKVPVGTQIKIGKELIADLTVSDQSILLCKGGQGGWGNWHFKTSIKQSPEWSKKGLSGEKKELELSLKLIADVGIIGLPNAGKSTLLSVISNARPKIADYPFTTLQPNLGVVKLGTKELIFADLPGLIEDAHLGKGLGDRFLRHLERTKLLIHLISSESLNLNSDFKIIQNELKKFSKQLFEKPQIVVVSKSEIINKEDLEKNIKKLEKTIETPVLVISSSTNNGLNELISKIFTSIR